jgi:hypothetical protein
MTRRQSRLVAGAFAALLILSAHPAFGFARAAKNSGAAETVRAFYRQHFSHDMGFTRSTLRQKQRWLTAELYGLLLYERRRKTPTDEAPHMNGDPFTNSQEYPNSFRVGKVNQSGLKADVEVVFVWRDRNRVVERKRCVVRLLRQRSVWKIEDIISDDGKSLLGELKELKRNDDSSRTE